MEHVEVTPIFLKARADITAFVHQSNWNEYVVNFPYGTFTIPRSGESSNEPGRRSPMQCVNRRNHDVVRAFVDKYNLNYEADPESVFLPALKLALITEFGEQAWKDAEKNHRQKFRMLQGIGAFINQTLTWGVALTNFNKNREEIQRLSALCRNISSVIVEPQSTSFANITMPKVVNIKAQDLARALPEKNCTIMINASAGSLGDMTGGTFGDPFYAMSTQEEDIYRTLPLGLQLFVQFVLSTYVEATTARDKIARFIYHDRYAPRNGRCLLLQNGKQYYLFSAAHDNTKSPMSYDNQVKLAEKVFSAAIETCIEFRIDTLIAGAFGIGVFKGSAQALADGIDNAIVSHHAGDESYHLEFILAYYIRDPNDATANQNFKVLQDKFSAPQ